MLNHLIISIILGGVSGWLAGILMKSNGTVVRNVLLGIAGGFIGDLILELIGISLGGYLGVIIVSVLGASLLIYLINKLF